MLAGLAALVVLVAAMVAGVSGAGAAAGYNLSLQWSPSPVTSGTGVTFTGLLTLGGAGVDDVYVEVDEYDTADCATDTFWDTAGYGYGYTDVNGNYSFGTQPGWPLVFTGGSGHYYLKATYWDGETPIVSSACLPLNAGSNVDHVFLCYSKFQVQPGVWSAVDAVLLMQAGYWQPTAVDGNVTGGTNVGKYNLQCNVTPKGDGYVDASGVFWPPNFAPAHEEVLGYYPH
jgi:hypothetical protein